MSILDGFTVAIMSIGTLTQDAQATRALQEQEPAPQRLSSLDVGVPEKECPTSTGTLLSQTTTVVVSPFGSPHSDSYAGAVEKCPPLTPLLTRPSADDAVRTWLKRADLVDEVDSHTREGLLEGYARRAAITMFSPALSFASPALRSVSPADDKQETKTAHVPSLRGLDPEVCRPTLASLELSALGMSISEESVGATGQRAWQVRALSPGEPAAASGLIFVGDFLWEIEGTCISMNGTSSLGVLACLASRAGKPGECRVGLRSATKKISSAPTNKITLHVPRLRAMESPSHNRGLSKRCAMAVDDHFDSPDGQFNPRMVKLSHVHSTSKIMARWHAQMHAIDKALEARGSLLSSEQVGELCAVHADLSSRYLAARDHVHHLLPSGYAPCFHRVVYSVRFMREGLKAGPICSS